MRINIPIMKDIKGIGFEDDTPKQFWEDRLQNPASTLRCAQLGAMWGTDAPEGRDSSLLWTLLKPPEPWGSKYCISSVQQQPPQMVKTESLCGMKASYYFQQGIWRHLQLGCISQRQLLVLHLLPLLKVTAPILSFSQSVFPPSSTSGLPQCTELPVR